MPQLTEGCLEKYGKKLIGRTDMEDALKKLDKLTQEEARMAMAENLKATHSVDDRVKGVADAVAAIDNRMAGVDDRVTGVDVRVAGLDDRVAGVDDRVARVASVTHVINDGVRGVREQVLVVDDTVKQIADDVDQARRSSSNFIDTDYGALHIISENQLRDSIHKWLSPPDPSTNHNIACDTHHKKTATWFFEGSFFREWKSTASLLWIHGKRAPSHTSHLMPSDEILNSSWLRQEYSLVSGYLAVYIVSDQYLLSVPPSSKISKPYVRPEKHRWRIFISTFGTPTSKACRTYFLPFSLNFLPNQVYAATFYPNCTRFTTMERNSLVAVL